MKIKIIHIISALNVGGAEALLFDLAKNINKDKFDVKILVFFKEGGFVEKFVNSRKCSVVWEFCGHGVGFAAHEPPVVLHYGKEKTGLRIAEGLVIAVEPIINAGKRELVTLSDGWTAVTKDGSLSAQFEETIAVTKNGVLVLTSLV